jgi:hypothetical protein
MKIQAFLTTKINEIEICYIGNVAHCNICKERLFMEKILFKNFAIAQNRYNEGMKKLLKIAKGEGIDYENV